MNKGNSKFRYKVKFCRVTHKNFPAETIISHFKELNDADIKRKFYGYFDKSVFEIISWAPMPMARKGDIRLITASGHTKPRRTH